MSRPSRLLALLAAVAAAALPTLIHAQVFPHPASSGGRVPEKPPLRPTTEAVRPFLDLGDTAAPGTVDLAYTPQGLVFGLRDKPYLRITVPAHVTAKLTDAQKGALISTVLNYQRSPDLAAAFSQLNSGSARVEIHYGNFYYDYRNGVLTGIYFGINEQSHIAYLQGSDDTSVAPGSTVYITINEQSLIDPSNGIYAATTTEQFALALLHELMHLIAPGREPFAEHFGVDEYDASVRTYPAYSALFTYPGFDTLNPAAAPEMLAGLIVKGGDAGGYVSASYRNDTVFGGAGADVVYGVGGNDVIFTFRGDDYLSGGPGENLLHGERGNDTYESQGFYDLIMDGLATGDPGTYELRSSPVLSTAESIDSADRLIARDVVVGTSTFLRQDNSLFIIKPDGATIQVDRQFLESNRIEYFEFANGLYTAADVLQLTAPPPPPPPRPRPCDRRLRLVHCSLEEPLR